MIGSVMSWGMFIVLMLAALCFVVIFFILQMEKMCWIKNIKNKYVRHAVSLIPLVIIGLLFIWSFSNCTAIVGHLFVILLVGKLIYYLIKKITKKDYKYGFEITIIVSTIFTAMYLGYAYYVAHNVIETHYDVVTKKDLGVENFRIVQISDSHIGSLIDGDKFKKYMEDINKTNPDIVVVTGDYIDDGTSYSDMVKACEGLGLLKTKYGVYFVYGNHDMPYYENKLDSYVHLEEELKKNNVTILEDQGKDIVGNIYLYGRKDKRSAVRKSAQEIMSEIDKNKYVIVLNHQPNDYENESKSQMDLVLSGHTHGGQFFPMQIIEMFGTNDSVYGKTIRDNTTFIVTSGIADWEVEFKTGTVAEYVVIDIKQN